MIDSSNYTKPRHQDHLIQIDVIHEELQGITVNRAVMFHIVNSYVYTIFKRENQKILFKKNNVYSFGNKLGQKLAQQECLGFMKHCVVKSEKNEGKQFVGQMKLLNNRIWANVFGNKGKLFSISNQTLKSSSYKIEDKEFTLCKSMRNSTNPTEIQYRQLVLQFCSGLIQGTLQKLSLKGEVYVGQTNQGDLFAQMKNLQRKNFEERSYNQDIRMQALES